MNRRLLVAAAVIAATALLAPVDAEAVPHVRDSVTGSGTVELMVDGVPGSVVSPFAIDARINPGGKKAKGSVSIAEAFTEGSVRCLEVRSLSEPEFLEATINVMTEEFGLVTLQVSDGNPEGLPDFVGLMIPSPRSPKDCSRLALAEQNVKGFVVTGDIDFVNA